MTDEEKDAVRLRLEAIAEAHDGRLTPIEVVYDAENADSPLHGYFEWDDALAALSHRLYQARKLIRSVHVEYQVGEETVSTVCFVRDPGAEREQGYVSIVSLKSDHARAVEALRHEFGSVSAALLRAQNIGLVLGLQDEIASLLAQVACLSERLVRAGS